MTIEKPIDSLTEADLRRLANEKVSESETLDYKLEMYSQSDSEKREMLRDVSSMANARGGHILIGIREEDEVAVEVVGWDGRVEPLHGSPGRRPGGRWPA